MYKDDKKYHMDLKENARGRFLKVSETFARGYSRFQVTLLFWDYFSSFCFYVLKKRFGPTRYKFWG